MTPQQQQSTRITLSSDEIFLIMLLREKKFQEVTIKVQDGAIVSVERSEKFIKKNGGLC